MDPQTPVPLKVPKSNKKWLLWVGSVFVVILLAVIGWMVWYTMQLSNSNAALQKEATSLQQTIDALKKKLAIPTATPPPGGSVTTGGDACSTQVAISQDTKNNIADAVSSGNTAALEGRMASSVNVVIAASEKQGPVTPAVAVSDMSYLTNGTLPWNFNLPAATLDSYKAGFYHQFFEGVTYTGKAANDVVVSFGFDTCGKINVVFMSVNAELLTT